MKKYVAVASLAVMLWAGGVSAASLFQDLCNGPISKSTVGKGTLNDCQTNCRKIDNALGTDYICSSGQFFTGNALLMKYRTDQGNETSWASTIGFLNKGGTMNTLLCANVDDSNKISFGKFESGAGRYTCQIN